MVPERVQAARRMSPLSQKTSGVAAVLAAQACVKAVGASASLFEEERTEELAERGQAATVVSVPPDQAATAAGALLDSANRQRMVAPGAMGRDGRWTPHLRLFC